VPVSTPPAAPLGAAVPAVVAYVAFVAFAALAAFGTVPSVAALICLPVSELLATFEPLTAPACG